MKKSKILILINHGVGLYNFRKELIKNLIDEEYEVIYALPYHDKIEKLKEIGGSFHEISIDRRGINPIKDLKLILSYIKLYKKINPDIVITYTIKPNIYGGIVCRLLKVKQIATITGLGSAVQKDGLVKKIIDVLYKLSLKSAETVFFQNESNSKYFDGIISEEKKILVPGSGVNTDWYFPKSKSKSEDLKFLFIGRAMKDKGIEEYIETAKLIKSENKNVKFQILGFYEDGRYKEIIDKLVKENIIDYLGESNDTRIEMSKADCIVLPSYHEGMSNVLQEGASMEKPLIASDISGCRELVIDNENGFLCKPRDSESLYLAVKKFIKLTEEERIKMGKKSRKHMIDNFDRRIVVRKYKEEIRKIIER